MSDFVPFESFGDLFQDDPVKGAEALVRLVEDDVAYALRIAMLKACESTDLVRRMRPGGDLSVADDFAPEITWIATQKLVEATHAKVVNVEWLTQLASHRGGLELARSIFDQRTSLAWKILLWQQQAHGSLRDLVNDGTLAEKAGRHVHVGTHRRNPQLFDLEYGNADADIVERISRRMLLPPELIAATYIDSGLEDIPDDKYMFDAF